MVNGTYIFILCNILSWMVISLSIAIFIHNKTLYFIHFLETTKVPVTTTVKTAPPTSPAPALTTQFCKTGYVCKGETNVFVRT